MRDNAVELAWAFKLAANSQTHAERMKEAVHSLSDQAVAITAVCGAIWGRAPLRESALC